MPSTTAVDSEPPERSRGSGVLQKMEMADLRFLATKFDSDLQIWYQRLLRTEGASSQAEG